MEVCIVPFSNEVKEEVSDADWLSVGTDLQVGIFVGSRQSEMCPALCGISRDD